MQGGKGCLIPMSFLGIGITFKFSLNVNTRQPPERTPVNVSMYPWYVSSQNLFLKPSPLQNIFLDCANAQTTQEPGSKSYSRL